MTIAAAVPAAPVWSEDLLSFATEQGVRAYLEPLWAAAWRVFPTARQVTAYREDDPELRDERSIIIDVRVPKEDVPLSQSRAIRLQWHREFEAICPPALQLLFSLRLDLVD
jgi:hypothetical protein